MVLNEERERVLKERFGDLRGVFTGTFMGENLGVLLASNHLLSAYSANPRKTINNFFLGFSQGGSRMESDDVNAPMVIKYHLGEMHHDRISSWYTSYAPITTLFVKYLIDVDEMLRLSKRWTKSVDLVRGTVAPEKINMKMFNSWTPKEDVAVKFIAENGSCLRTHLPDGFPYIVMNEGENSFYPQEDEILLPPCEYEILESWKSRTGTTYAKVKLRPLSMAKVFLQCMKNPPSDYPQFFIDKPEFEYQTAMKMLEKYIKKYVDKKKIRLGDRVVDELPDPEVVFSFEPEGAQP